MEDRMRKKERKEVQLLRKGINIKEGRIDIN
jgi:hypothetical protein